MEPTQPPKMPESTLPSQPILQSAASLPQTPAAPPPQNQSNPPNSPKTGNAQFGKLMSKFNSYSKNTKILIIALVVTFFSLFLLTIVSSLFVKKTVPPLPTPTPVPPSVSPEPNVVLNASRYATDSGVLKMESDFNDFQKQLDASDVKQTDLSIPNLDFNINFNK